MHRRQRPEMRQFNRISGVAMVNADQIEETTREASTALVPLTPVLQWVRKMPLTRPDPSFVTQLIANAEHLPQASRLRRGSSEDARMAYGSKRPLPSVSARTRQVA
ncbi:hypothetical protein ACVWZ4_002129 [Bradyrhizobium sp. USDA 4472]